MQCSQPLVHLPSDGSGIEVGSTTKIFTQTSWNCVQLHFVLATYIVVAVGYKKGTPSTTDLQSYGYIVKHQLGP